MLNVCSFLLLLKIDEYCAAGGIDCNSHMCYSYTYRNPKALTNAYRKLARIVHILPKRKKIADEIVFELVFTWRLKRRTFFAGERRGRKKNLV